MNSTFLETSAKFRHYRTFLFLNDQKSIWPRPCTARTGYAIPNIIIRYDDTAKQWFTERAPKGNGLGIHLSLISGVCIKLKSVTVLKSDIKNKELASDNYPIHGAGYGHSQASLQANAAKDLEKGEGCLLG